MSVDDVAPPGAADADDAAGDADATHAGPPITVEVVDGPDAGRKKRVRGGRMVVGRGDGCDLKLVDTACSRRHMEIIVGFSGSVVRDLGSGNGTRVNGEKVDEAQVGHGDEIIVGTTVLKIIDELAALEERRRPKVVEPPPEVEPAEEYVGEPQSAGAVEGTAEVALPAEPGLNRRNLLLLGGLGGLGLLTVLALVLILRPAPKPSPAHPPPTAVDETASAQLLQQGKAALAAGDYDKANALWDQLEKADPQNSELADLRTRTSKEREAKLKLAAAQGLIAEHRFDEARDALKAIAPESLVSDQAAELLKGLAAQQVDFVATTASAKLQAGDLAGAREALPELMRLDAARGDALAKDIEAAQAELDRQALAGARNRKQRERMLKQMKKQKADEAVRQELLAGYRKFQEASSPGGYDRAANEFQRISETTRNPAARTRAQDLIQKVRAFSRSLQDADQLDRDQSYEAEVGPLDKALVALEDIEPSSPLATKLKNRMVRGLVIKGRNAAARQDYAVAAKCFNKALQLKPGEASAKEGLQSLRSRAQEVYFQAYEEEGRDADSARKLYRAVLDMTPSSEDLHAKAQKRLDHLASGGD